MEKENLLKNTEDAFFQTLSVLHEKNADETGIEEMKKRTPFLTVLGEDVFYIYRRGSTGSYAWTEYAYEAGERLPEFFFSLATAAMEEYLQQFGENVQKAEFSDFFAGIWEKELSKGCVFAVYAPETVRLFETDQEIFLYAAAKKVIETYFVTEDMLCHLPSCAFVKPEDVIGVFGTQKETAKYGAAPCPACLLWEVEE